MAGHPPSVGSRVSLRYRTPAGDSTPLTDVVGHLEAVHPLVAVRTKSGELVEIDPGNVVSVRELSFTPVRTSDIRALEHAAALAWPGTEQYWLDGWLLRAAGGVTSRANSAIPLEFSATLAPLPAIIAWYRERSLEPWLALPERVLPIRAAGVKATRVMVRDVGAEVTVSDVELLTAPDAGWLTTYGRDVPVDILSAVVDGTVVFAQRAGVAVGRGAVTAAPDGTAWLGISSVRVDDAQRRHGHARAICTALLAWGAGQGAKRAYVEVLSENSAAITLYESMGFRLHHSHRYVNAHSIVGPTI